MEENISNQVEEIEALCSIYGKLWHTEDEFNRAYSVTVSEGDHDVTLYITLPPEYPSQSPPIYELLAPSLSRLDKLELSGKLENIYLDNIGESILYQWVEATKDFLHEKSLLKQLDVPASSSDYAGEEVVSERGCKPPSQEHTHCKDIPAIIHGETITDRKSIFQGHAAVVTSIDQVKQVLSTLMENKKIANATHNMYAYRFQKQGQPSCLVQDCEDDGETAAGGRMLHLIQIMDVMNVLVVVTRWFGGVHLGPDRFRHINNATRQVLQQAGFVNKK